ALPYWLSVCDLRAWTRDIHSAVSLKNCSESPPREKDMSDWLHGLPVLWMAILVFGFTYLITAGIYAVITVFAAGERARSFKAISPGLLPPLGIIFGLFVVFTAAQVWTDNEKAKAEIDREASALRSAAILATSFPREYQVQLRELIRRYVADVVAQEWPMMAQGTANLRAIPGVLAEALQATLALNPSSEGQKTAQRDIATALETALDARRQRIIISESKVNLLKWVMSVHAGGLRSSCHCHGPLRQPACLYYCNGNLRATGVAASILLILAHDRTKLGRRKSSRSDDWGDVAAEAARRPPLCSATISSTKATVVKAAIHPPTRMSAPRWRRAA